MVLRTPMRPRSETPRPERRADAWWALGDRPVRRADTLVPLIDGRSALLAMCVAFLTAKRSIWLADWGLDARIRMVRGRDQRAGADGSDEQEALLQRLREAGLDGEALALWQSGNLRVEDVLAFAAWRGVDVRMLLWGPFDPLGIVHLVRNPALQKRRLERFGVTCRLDKSSRSPLHIAQSLHQKFAVVDGMLAFAGGVDLTIQPDGDYDRWDTQAHPFGGELRGTGLAQVEHGWHDVHLMLSGEPAADIEHNFLQRWDGARMSFWHHVFPPVIELARMWLSGEHASGKRAFRAVEQGAPVPGAGPAIQGPAARVQVVRTIPGLTYRFAPMGVHSLVQSYILAVRQARDFIYFESQYLWLEQFSGIDIWRLGWQSPAMTGLFDELVAAARRGVTMAFVLPDHPNAGRGFTDGTIAWLRQQAPHAHHEGRLRFFTLASSAAGADGKQRYRPIYVHAKVTVVDDKWATAGSANLNSRGMSHDAELNVAVLDDEFARTLRLALWSEHAGARAGAVAGWPEPGALPLPEPLVAPPLRGLYTLLRPTDPCAPVGVRAPAAELETLTDPIQGIARLAVLADENLRRLRNGEPLVGNLLPYLLDGEGERYGLPVNHEQGCLDPRQSSIDGILVSHPGKYT